MNNENNEMNNMGPTVAPSVPDPAQPNPMGMPDPAQPVTPPVEAVPEQTPAAPMGMAEPAPVASPVGMPDPAQPASPMGGPAMGGQPGMPEEPKKSNTGLIIIIAVVLLVGLGVGAYFLFGGKDDPEEPNGGGNQTATKADEEFLALANKYVAAVQKMWDEDTMVCQDSSDQTGQTFKKPSELPSAGAYGNAEYYVFIDTDNSNEIKLGVDNSKSVAGWIRVVKADKSFYVSLSDGTNYIVDKGAGFDKKASELTKSDVVTNGNGNNYQYKNEDIFGSQTDGNGWGIGDSKVVLDDDTTNDGIYMYTAKKTQGWTPYCKNAE